MPIDFDPNLVAAEFLKANIDGAVAIAKGKVKGAANFVRSQFERTYHAYIERLVQRHSKAKSFFVRSEPIPLYDFFVPLDLRTQRRTLAKPSALDLGAASGASILTGSGGSGKSMMMRHLLLSSLAGGHKTPLFVELRSLNTTEPVLQDALLASLTANGLSVDHEYLELALKAGHFLLLLDGYDELDRAHRRKLTRAIQDLAERYPKNWLVLSSRPDADLQGWTGFTTWQVAPLDLGRAVELVTRLTFDPAIKQRFIDALRTNLFAQHESFLSNPLLLSIMLLTYHDTALIPTKLSIFYNQAYESLFQKHDALKAGYQRERLTTLDIQEFERVFAAFSVQSFDKREFTFPSTRALELLDHSKRLTHLTFDSPDFLRDAVQAVCLLVEEGMDIAFAHRSFQEYFTARFIAGATPLQKAQLIKRFARTTASDSVVPLLWEIDPYSVEQHFILPNIQKLRQAIGYKKTLGKTVYLKYLRAVFKDFEVTENNHVVTTVTHSDIVNALIFVYQRYVRSEADRHQIPTNELAEAFKAEFGDRLAVPIVELTSSSSFLAKMSASRGIWGKETVKALLDVEQQIQERHRDAQESLDAILS